MAFFLCFTTAASAQDLQLGKLFCVIRDGKFLTTLDFKVQVVTDHPEMVGELANYLIQENGSRKYISGLLFTHLAANNSKVIGDTGDPNDVIGRFALGRMDMSYAGRWAYVFQRSATEVVHAIFNCGYDSTPPAKTRGRRPSQN